MKELREVRGNMNAMQGDFTALHGDVAILREQIENNYSLPSSRHDGSRGGQSSRRSEATYSNHLSEHHYYDMEGWHEDAWQHHNGRVGGYGANQGRGNNRGGHERGGDRYDDPSRNFKHTIPEFHGKFEPDTYLEWESQVDKIFSLHNYSEEDKIKLVLAEFRGHANTWWTEIMRNR